MKRKNIIKYSIFSLLVIMILLCLYDNFKKNEEKYTINKTIITKKNRPSL